MKRGVEKRRVWPVIVGIILVLFFALFIVFSLSIAFFDGSRLGNVALIPIEGPIMGNGESYLGQTTVSSKEIAAFIAEADQNSQIKVIVLEINSPGGSAVASDEIASAVKNAEKPVVALIREVGASGGYWVASAADHIIANKMSITGSIGVISSYLEFSNLMNKYGIDYERLVAGERKDVGTPFRDLQPQEREILQQKLNRIHTFFIQEVAQNRGLQENHVKKIATGEFYLGIEALELGLIDQLGDQTTLEEYIKKEYNLDELRFVTYQRQLGFVDLFSGVFANFFFTMGKGFGSILLQHEYRPQITLM